jgi:small redox-active disulfide protein 2
MTKETTMISVKILGSGCARCKTLHAKVLEVAVRNDLPVTVSKVEDIKEIMKYGVLATPGLVVNERVKSTGFIPKDEDLLAYLNEG